LKDTSCVYENLLPTIEALCSEVNDHYLYLRISTKCTANRHQKISADRNKLELPGVADVCLIAREAARVCDGYLLKQTCPSALEFLAWVDSSKTVSVQNINNDRREDEKGEKASVTDVANDDSALYNFGTNASGDLSMLLSSQIVGEDAIEMLPPRQNSTYDADESDDDSAVKNSTPGRKEVAMSSPLVGQNHLTKQKRDLSWVIGVNRLPDHQIKYLWQPRMMATTSLTLERSWQSRDLKRSDITCMAPNESESLLAAGNSNGEVMVFDLRRHPPLMTHRMRLTATPESDQSIRSICQVGFIDCNSLLVCDGGLHLWDVETGTTRSSMSTTNSVLYCTDKGIAPWKTLDFVAFSLFPSTTSSMLHSSCCEIAAISQSCVYMIDMRCPNKVQHQHFFTTEAKCRKVVDPMMRHLAWYLSSPPNISISHRHPHYKNLEQTIQQSSFNLNAIASHSDWVVVGSASGHIHCFDRRKASLLCCWKAHTKSIEHLHAVSRHLLLSVSADKTAVLWNLAQNPPQQLRSIYSKCSVCLDSRE
jgi:WD40 repeat protein